MKSSFKKAFTLVEIMIVVLIIGVLLAIAVPNFIRARESSRTKACIANLKQIDAAKQQWAMDNRVPQTSSTFIDYTDLSSYMKSMPQCPSAGGGLYGSGGGYIYGSMNADPYCMTVPSTHVLP